MRAVLECISPDGWTLVGEVTPQNALILRQQGEQALKQAGNTLIIDLQGITRPTSAAISVLLCWMRAAESNSKKICFSNMPAKMFDIARVSGLDGVLPRIH